MRPYFEFSSQIRKGISVSGSVVTALADAVDQLTPAQRGAIVAFLEHAPQAAGYRELLDTVLAAKDAKPLASQSREDRRTRSGGLTLASLLTGATTWSAFVRSVTDGSASDMQLGYWLAAVTMDDMSSSDAIELTEAMRRSGDVFDYRPTFPDDRMIRRYPTGALSEKVALIMPIVLSAIRHRLNNRILSPFIVAKALGHTGGTWDKLSALPGFVFPLPGEPSEQVLRECGVCYSVTHGAFNPADRRLYALRSETDTIECSSLIVSSIASKMLACPVHRMQIDARVGSGAFFSLDSVAEETSRQIAEVCSSDGMTCFYTVTPADQPTGSTVGSPLELIEAMEALGAPPSGRFDARGVHLQRAIVAEFVARLVSEEIAVARDDLYAWTLQSFQDQSFQADFVRVLVAHGVRRADAEAYWTAPWQIVSHLTPIDVLARETGRLARIDQRRLGLLANDKTSPVYFNLKVRKFDRIAAAQPLCEVWTRKGSNIPIDDVVRLFDVE